MPRRSHRLAVSLVMAAVREVHADDYKCVDVMHRHQRVGLWRLFAMQWDRKGYRLLFNPAEAEHQALNLRDEVVKQACML